MTWAQRLKRVLNIDIETCSECGGYIKVIACLEDPIVIEKILTHLKLQKQKELQAAPELLALLPQERAPPQSGLFD